ncbi:hypothetical protein [Brachybacterium phenoliresistens]|uniref:hypothetical protein n=1 Tax=Brachybacterium phenoliresistens TaxID=396014 RepID=UPI0031DCBE44
MTSSRTIPSSSPSTAASRPPADALTVAAAVSLLIICILHTVVFAIHPWWGAWLAGPFRTGSMPAEAMVPFWGLPGGFVVPGVLFALLVLEVGRRGGTVPGYVGAVLGIWALLCIWMVGPSGFVMVLVPSALLLLARRRARRAARDAA